MSTENKSSDIHVSRASDRVIESKELIDRLAEELRASSDVGLPHSYFVEQVKLGLAGTSTRDLHADNDSSDMGRKTAANESASVFMSWAMPD
ncbi:MAG: hypothetical protein ACOH2J_17465 [Allorhizobium sp.]